MSSQKLPHYLRTFRKRSGLSQDELAYLLCLHSGTKVCRYERFAQRPSLRTAIAYGIIFREPVEELFGGLFHDVRRKILKRTGLLQRRVQRLKPDSLRARKLEALNAIKNP